MFCILSLLFFFLSLFLAPPANSFSLFLCPILSLRLSLRSQWVWLRGECGVPPLSLAIKAMPTPRLHMSSRPSKRGGVLLIRSVSRNANTPRQTSICRCMFWLLTCCFVCPCLSVSLTKNVHHTKSTVDPENMPTIQIYLPYAPLVPATSEAHWKADLLSKFFNLCWRKIIWHWIWHCGTCWIGHFLHCDLIDFMVWNVLYCAIDVIHLSIPKSEVILTVLMGSFLGRWATLWIKISLLLRLFTALDGVKWEDRCHSHVVKY